MNLRKYLIMGSQNCREKPETILKTATQAGITAFQFREKGKGALTGKAKIALGQRLRDICRRHHVLFFINDDIDLAEPLEADGIHVGQDDTRLETIRQRFPDKYIGLSVANEQEVTSSPIHLADYLGAGPIFATSSKKDAQQAVGINWIKSLKQQYPSMPIVGIGGITTKNASSVISAGADGVSVISAITKADDIDKAVKSL